METKSLLAILFLLLAITAVYFFVWPAYGDILTQIKAKDEAMVQLDQTKNDLQQLEKAVVKLTDPATVKTDKMVPTSSGKFSMYMEMESLVSRSGMVFKSLDMVEQKPVAPAKAVAADTGDTGDEIKLNKMTTGAMPAGGAKNTSQPASATVKDKQSTLDLTISVSGSYDNLKKLLTMLEQEQRLIDVVSFSYASSAQSGQSGSSLGNEGVSGIKQSQPPAMTDFTINAKAYFIYE